MLHKTNKKKLQIKFYKPVVAPTLLYGSESWTTRKKENRIQTQKIKFLKTVKGCRRLDIIRNRNIKNRVKHI